MILIADIDAEGRAAIRRALDHQVGADYQVLAAESAAAGLAFLERMKDEGGEVAIVVGSRLMDGMQGAVHLAHYAEAVTMVCRGDSLAESMSDYLVREVERLPNIRTLFLTQVTGGRGVSRLTELEPAQPKPAHFDESAPQDLRISPTTSRSGGRCFLRQHDVAGWLRELRCAPGDERSFDKLRMTGAGGCSAGRWFKATRDFSTRVGMIVGSSPKRMELALGLELTPPDRLPGDGRFLRGRRRWLRRG